MARLDLRTISEDALRLVCEQKWQESESLDFKRELPAKDDRGRREFLKDVCALANAFGGDLLFGISEQEGAASELAPLEGENSDAAILRLGQLVDSGVEPRLPGLQFHVIPLSRGFALIVRVPASFDGPHRYLVNDACRFVLRSGRHTVDMSYAQLRTAFGATALLADRARAFRRERLAQIPQAHNPLPLRVGPFTVVHVIPLEAMTPGKSVDITPLYYQHSALDFEDWGSSRILNLDGLLVHASAEKDTLAYSLMFRSGSLETVRFSGLTISDDKTIPSLTIAKFIRQAIPKMAKLAQERGAVGPAIVGLAMLRVSGWSFALDANHYARPADRNDLVLPEVWLDDLDAATNVDALAKPLLDLVWQAYGQPSCRYYKEGKWSPKD